MSNFLKPGVVYSIGCTLAPFDIYTERDKDVHGQIVSKRYDIPYNMAQSYTVRDLNCGVALLGNTRQSYENNAINLEASFYSVVKNNRKLGIAESLSKVISMDVYPQFPRYHKATIHTHSLIGDPEMELWLDVPYKLNLDLNLFDNRIQTLCHDNTSSLQPTNQIISIFNGNSEQYSWSVGSGNIELPLPSFIKNDIWCVSYWKTGFLPIIELHAQNFKLTNDEKRFLVSNAYLGRNVNEHKTSGDLTIGSNGVLHIDAMESIKTSDGFIIESSGQVCLYGRKEVECNDTTVKTGGGLEAQGETVILGPGFTLEEGATLSINNK